MRYKNNVLDKLNQDQVLESIEMLKEVIESTREMVSIESDDFEQQFRPQ